MAMVAMSVVSCRTSTSFQCCQASSSSPTKTRVRRRQARSRFAKLQQHLFSKHFSLSKYSPAGLSPALLALLLPGHSLAAGETPQSEILDPGTATVLLNVLGPVFASFNLLFIARIVMSWYPKIPVDKLPFVIAYAATEPVLAPTRRLIPPIGGVDMSPVAWFAFLSFSNEVLLGPQGLLVMLSEKLQ